MLTAVLAVPQTASAAGCGSWWNPVCWVRAGLDYTWDTVEGVVKLVGDTVTLDFDDAFEDLKQIGYNGICEPVTSVFTMAVANGLEKDFDDCAGPTHPIDAGVLSRLRLYIKSPLESVRIHENCDLNADTIPTNEANRTAITFGEHIYFKAGAYHPADAAGFALLAHELTHVLQYRKKGFADFSCEYATQCALGLRKECDIEKSAYEYQALVRDDQDHDADGVMSPVDNCINVANPDQTDSDHDGEGNACDPGTQCTGNGIINKACPPNHAGRGYEYMCSNGWMVPAGGWCVYQAPSGGDRRPRPQEP